MNSEPVLSQQDSTIVKESWKKVNSRISIERVGIELCKKFKELVPGLDSSLGNDELQDFCHSVITTTNRLVQNITNTQWLKSIALRMGTIYGVDVNGYVVLEDAIIETLQELLQEEFTIEDRQSWEMFYKHLHQLPKYQ
ncbi:uncharacterized protein [Dysidea avara]|uniref:uncharacterized protein n=1 Tax=Dysidea avara TaxID=196820 RepID=UPI0033283016